MKKAVVASLLAFSAATGMVCGAHVAIAQTQVNLGSKPAGDVQMAAAEYKDYTDANALTDPKAKTAAIEAYLTKYPQSSVKAAMLETLAATYSGFDPAKTLDAADRLLQVDPNNLRGLILEVYFRKAAGDQATDPAAKQTAYDGAADMAQKGITASATKPKDVDQAAWDTLKGGAVPVFYSAIATAALNKKDAPTAIDNLKKELASVPIAATTAPGPVLQDTYALATAYYQSTPPDLLNCAFYAARAANFAPEPYKSQMLPLAKYCYKKFHGAEDGLDAVTTLAAANLNPPATYASSVKPAPTTAEIIHGIITTTTDLGTLAVSDKELVFANGSPEDAAKVWDSVKGKSTQFPDALVIAATESSVQVAVSEDAVQSKTADFTFNTAAPLKTVPTVGSKITISGTYASFTPSPLMITMSDADVAEPKKAPVKKAPAKPTPARRPAAHK